MLSRVSVGSSYFPDLIVPMLVLSIGMGLVFVPLTLTAVVGVPKNDTGIASAVLNTMQQIGGAIGLATLSTVAVNAQTAFIRDQAAAAVQAGGAPTGGSPAQIPQALFNASFTHGATQAFQVSAVIVLAGAVLVYTLLTISHRELANDEATPTAAV